MVIHTANPPGKEGERGRNVGGAQGGREPQRGGGMGGMTGGQGQQKTGATGGQMGGQGARGASAITQELQNVNFPVTKQELIQKHGDRQVEIEQGKRVPLREVLNKIPGDRFTNQSELTQKVNENWNEIQRLGR